MTNTIRNPFLNLRDRELSLQRNREGAGLTATQASGMYQNRGAGGGGWPGDTSGRGGGAGGMAYPDGWYSSTATMAPTYMPYYTVNNASTSSYNFVVEEIEPTPETPEEIAIRKRRGQYLAAVKAKNKIVNLYKVWKTENRNLSQSLINSPYGSHKKHNWSIEARLLSAIYKREGFKTKTTEYSPHTSKIYLFGHEIVKISSESYDIIHVTLPEFTKSEDINLFRLRLRQLGLRCRTYNKKTIIKFEDGKNLTLIPGEVTYIPAEYRGTCLPIGYAVAAAPVSREPLQISLYLVGGKTSTELLADKERERELKKDNPFVKYCDVDGNHFYRDYQIHFSEAYNNIQNCHIVKVSANPINKFAYSQPRDSYEAVYSMSQYEALASDAQSSKVIIYKNLVEQVKRAIDEKNATVQRQDPMNALLNRTIDARYFRPLDGVVWNGTTYNDR
jgi:hypothetical protein